MSDGKQQIFRAVALERAASPEQLDYLVVITRPFDWIVGLAILLALTAAIYVTRV
jgi:HlyD family secretion protein